MTSLLSYFFGSASVPQKSNRKRQRSSSTTVRRGRQQPPDDGDGTTHHNTRESEATEDEEEEEEEDEEEEEEEEEEEPTDEDRVHSIEARDYIQRRKRMIQDWWTSRVCNHPVDAKRIAFTSECVHGTAIVQVYHVAQVHLSQLEAAILYAPACIQDIVFHMPDASENKQDNAPFVAIHFDAHPPRANSQSDEGGGGGGADDDDDSDVDEDVPEFRKQCIQRSICDATWHIRSPADELRVCMLAQNLLTNRVISPLQGNLHALIPTLATASGPMLTGNSLQAASICSQLASVYGPLSPVHLSMQGKLIHNAPHPHRTRLVLTVHRMPALPIKILRDLVCKHASAIEDITIDMTTKSLICVVFPAELAMISPYRWTSHANCYTASANRATRRRHGGSGSSGNNINNNININQGGGGGRGTDGKGLGSSDGGVAAAAAAVAANAIQPLLLVRDALTDRIKRPRLTADPSARPPHLSIPYAAVSQWQQQEANNAQNNNNNNNNTHQPQTLLPATTTVLPSSATSSSSSSSAAAIAATAAVVAAKKITLPSYEDPFGTVPIYRPAPLVQQPYALSSPPSMPLPLASSNVAANATPIITATTTTSMHAVPRLSSRYVDDSVYKLSVPRATTQTLRHNFAAPASNAFILNQRANSQRRA